MGKRIHRMKTWLMDYAYLVTLGAVIAVIAASAIYTRNLRDVQAADVPAAAEAPETELTPEPSLQPKITPLATIAPLQVRYMNLASRTGTCWPVNGEIIRAYDEQNLVFWESIGAWSVHRGIDVAGVAGQAVLCAADGVVKTAMRDELWGWRVTVDQTDGRQAVYAGLEAVDVLSGQAVTRGQQVGTLLAKIPCEAELGAHLHMELSRDGRLQDPEGMLPER